MDMNYQTLKKINRIIERDSKDTTYKFALLRATIDIIQQKAPQIRFEGAKVRIPIGLIVVKWLEYYYPIIEAELPQKNGDKITSNTLAFRELFKRVTDFYTDKGGFPVFYYQLLNEVVDEHIEDVTRKLCKSIRDTLKKQPMRYIGSSVYQDHYQVYQPEQSNARMGKSGKLSIEYLIDHCGDCFIPRDYYDAFELMGSFITGSHSILFNWADFTVQKSGRELTTERVLNTLLTTPTVERNVALSEKIFQQVKQKQGELSCVWSDKSITNDLNIDHVLPFSVWRNNDLWNLLPAKESVNSKKRDKIPSLQLLDSRKDRIIEYWRMIKTEEQECFQREVKLNLIGNSENTGANWDVMAFEALKHKCKYLIETRGFEEFHFQ